MANESAYRSEILRAAATLLQHEGVLIQCGERGPLTPDQVVDEFFYSLYDPETVLDLTLKSHDLTVSRCVTVGEVTDDPADLLRVMVSLREHFVNYPGAEG